MRLIVIYGQEATGKLTIAKALAAKTGFKLFHNHLSVDVANSLYQYGAAEYDELVFAVRLLVFESAATHGVDGLIFTWAYTHPQCFDQYLKILSVVEPYGAEVHLVHVHCSQASLETRVLSEERGAMGKINTVAHLHRQQQRKNCIEIPGSGSLVLDNTSRTAEEAVDLIIDRFALYNN